MKSTRESRTQGRGPGDPNTTREIEYQMENIRAQRSDELGFILAPKYMGIQAGKTSNWMTGIENQNKIYIFAEINLRVRIHNREKGHQNYAKMFEIVFKLSITLAQLQLVIYLGDLSRKKKGNYEVTRM